MKFASISLAAAIAAVLAESSTAQIQSHRKRLGRSLSVEQGTDDLEPDADFPPGYPSMPGSMPKSPESMSAMDLIDGSEQKIATYAVSSKSGKHNPSGPPTVDVPGLGTIEGQARTNDATTLVEFLGIPYAKPPLRWQPPQEHSGWEGTFEATDYGSACFGFQKDAPGTTGDEDCLFLDIIAPRAALNAGKKKLSVMVYFHEGGFLRGSGEEYANEMAALVASSRGKVIGVSINYRVGVFGLLGGTQLSLSTQGAGSGNFAIMDQRMAMSWVKSNIKAFGGDPNDVTIFGHSAGAHSVMHHLVQPQSFSLYNKAIIQSGTYDYSSVSMGEADIIFETIVGALNQTIPALVQSLLESGIDCTVPAQQVACLKQVPAEFMFLISTGVYDSLTPTPKDYPKPSIPILLPVIDGVSLPDSPSQLFNTAQYNNNVPVIIGSTTDEYLNFVLRDISAPPFNLTENQFNNLAPYSSMTTEMLAELKEVYADVMASESYSKFYRMHIRYASDLIPALGHCSDRWLARRLVAGGTPAVYNYVFDQKPTMWTSMFAPGVSSLGAEFAPHLSDIPYTFDRMPAGEDADPLYAPNLGKIMSAYWYGLATSNDGKPKLSKASKKLGGIKWHKFTEDKETTLVFEAGGVRMQEDVNKKACDWQLEQVNVRGGFPAFLGP